MRRASSSAGSRLGAAESLSLEALGAHQDRPESVSCCTGGGAGACGGGATGGCRRRCRAARQQPPSLDSMLIFSDGQFP